MSAITQFDRVVSKFMNKPGYGFDVKVTVQTDGVYNPSTGEYTETTSEVVCKGMMFDFIIRTSGDGTYGNTLIRRGDKQLFLRPPAKSLVFNTPAITSLKPERDTITIGEDLYEITWFKDLNPSTTDSCLWELYIRK